MVGRVWRREHEMAGHRRLGWERAEHAAPVQSLCQGVAQDLPALVPVCKG